MLKLFLTVAYKKQAKKYKHNKRVNQELAYVVDLLVNEKPIPEKYRSHKLIGAQDGLMDVHIRPDDLLIYLKIKKKYSFDCHW